MIYIILILGYLFFFLRRIKYSGGKIKIYKKLNIDLCIQTNEIKNVIRIVTLISFIYYNLVYCLKYFLQNSFTNLLVL